MFKVVVCSCRGAVLSLLALVVAPFALLGQAPRFEGKRVVAVEYDPPTQPADSRDLERAQAVKTGAPYRPSAVSESIDRLFASGHYSDIQVDVQPRDNGVVVKFITTGSRFVGHIEVRGKVSTPPNRPQIRSAVPLHLGQPFDEAALQNAQQTLKRLFEDNGLYESDVQFERQDRERHQLVDVTIRVRPGKRAKYEAPIIRGDTKLSDSTIIRATGWKIRFIGWWRQVTSSRTLHGVDGIREKYRDEDRLTADVDLTSVNYDAERRRVKATITADAGPKVKVKALETKVSQGKLKKYVPIFQEGAVDRDLLVEGARNLRDYFQFRGYPDVDVTFRQLPVQNDEQVIEYSISRGQKRLLGEIEIVGNKYFDLDTIRERMFLEPRSFQFRHGRYSEAFRKRDEETIEQLYRTNGFRDVKVKSSIQNDYKGKPDRMLITFTIDEGPQWLVGNIDSSSIQLGNAKDILGEFSSQPGQPFSELNVSDDRKVILTHYYKQGYPNASFEFSMTPAKAPHQVDLVYKVTPGPQQYVRDVVLTGLRNTRRRVLRPYVRIAKQAPLSPVQISNVQRDLYDLGLFARINSVIQNYEGDTQYKNVIIDFEEASRYTLNVGVGAEVARFGGTASDLNAPAGNTGFSPRLALDVTRHNFMGVGQTITFRSRVSNLQQRASLSYLAPRISGVEGLDLTVSGLYDLSRDVRTFASRRQEASVQLSQRLSRASTGYLRFAYRRVSTSDVVIPTLLVPQLLQPVRVGMLSGNFVQDRRDNPGDAHRGIWNTLDAGLASKFFGSQRTFSRILGRNATYHPIGDKLVLARQTTAGFIFPFAIPEGFTEENVIPLPERFFGGGGISHRGFPENQAGPRDIGSPAGPGAQQTRPTGFPLGGNALLFNTLELRFPLSGNNISGVLFHDAGNLYSSAGNVSFRVKQRNLQDFNYMVHAAGFGIRYKTPVGPVRLDLAYSINPPRFVGFKGTTQDLLACNPSTPADQLPSQCRGTTQSTSHFQFFFSIGQTF